MDPEKMERAGKAAVVLGKAAAAGALALLRARKTARTGGKLGAALELAAFAADFLAPSVAAASSKKGPEPQKIEILECKVIGAGRRRSRRR